MPINRGQSTAPMMKQALNDGMPAGDSMDETQEHDFNCPACGAKYKLVPAASEESTETDSGPMSDADIIDSYAKK